MTQRRILGLLTVAALLASAGAISGSAATPPTPLTREQIAQNLLDSPAGRLMTGPARRALEIEAHRDAQSAVNSSTASSVKLSHGGHGPSTGSLMNVRVNDPGEDTHQTDQTTQSETAIAVSGLNVAVGFNDSQQGLLALTPGADLSGYAYSRDGGHTFTDGGAIPNPTTLANFGDPWLAADRSGAMYYSTLTFDIANFVLGVGVAKSTDGGKTWSQPVLASPQGQFFYFGDKDAMTTGPDPTTAARDNIYVAWDDTAAFSAGGGGGGGSGPLNGLAVATSKDGGATYSLAYADRIPFPDGVTNCNFGQYIGAYPLVDKTSGTLYVAATKIYVAQTCPPPPPPPPAFGFGGGGGGGGGGGPVFSQVIFKSTDGGATFDHGTTIATITSPFPYSALLLGPGQYMRIPQFPELALRNGSLYATWHDGVADASGNAPNHIRLATSRDSGATWSTSYITSGSNDEVQPAISSDSAGIHVLYYQRNGDNTLDAYVADSTDGVNFTTQRVTSQSFPGVVTVPQVDPIIAYGYMGDYIANVSDGSTQYFAWGDNRDIVTNFLWPQGRHDPDVFFARR